MAEKIGILPRLMDKELVRMRKRIEKYAPVVAEKLAAQFPSSCYERIVSGIFKRGEQLSRATKWKNYD